MFTYTAMYILLITVTIATNTTSVLGQIDDDSQSSQSQILTVDNIIAGSLITIIACTVILCIFFLILSLKYREKFCGCCYKLPRVSTTKSTDTELMVQEIMSQDIVSENSVGIQQMHDKFMDMEPAMDPNVVHKQSRNDDYDEKQIEDVNQHNNYGQIHNNYKQSHNDNNDDEKEEKEEEEDMNYDRDSMYHIFHGQRETHDSMYKDPTMDEGPVTVGNKESVDEVFDNYKQYLQWTHTEILQWIMTLNEGIFRVYHDRLEQLLRMNVVTGVDLDNVELHDIESWGIRDIQNQQILLNHIHRLTDKEHKEGN